jgi:AraC family transcriptional regulator
MGDRTVLRENPVNNKHAPRQSTQHGFDAITTQLLISPADAAKRHAVTLNGVTAESVHFEECSRLEIRFRGVVHLLALFEEGARNDGETLVEGSPHSTLRNYRRKLLFVPAGHEYYDWQEPRDLPRLAYFYFDPAALGIDPNHAFTHQSFVPRLFFEDAKIWDYAMKLKTLIDNPQGTDQLYCEALGTVLAHELLRLRCDVSCGEHSFQGGLAAWQQRVVASYIDEHLEEQISLATLATLVRLSPNHFCRSFKQSFGMPPHQFHKHRRIESAKALLATRSISVTGVAMAIGFNEASSFTTAFRKTTGLTPTGYRRSVVSTNTSSRYNNETRLQPKHRSPV